jgi:hypothetical protein
MSQCIKAAIFLTCLVLLTAWCGCSSPRQPEKVDKAAVIDQLSLSDPNPSFIEKTVTALQNQGLTVDYFQGEEISLDLYRDLPAGGYRLIVFRVHSGLLGHGRKSDQHTCLFTNQLYHQKSEIGEQLANRVVKSGVGDQPPVFGINADFISGSLRSEFHHTAIVMMGCSSLDSDDMARAFIQKGASIYTGWDESVGLGYVEDATLTLLAKLFNPEVSVETAVRETMQEKGADIESGSVLKYYPETIRTKPLCGLIY